MAIEVHVLHDGRRSYEVRFRGPDRVERTRRFRTRKSAEQFEAEQLATMARGAWIDPRRTSTTFGQVAAQWIESNPTKREGTRERDQTILRVHILPALGNDRLAAITRSQVQGLVNTWSASGSSPASVRRQYGVLAAVFNHAVADELLARSACRAIRLPVVAHATRHVITGAQLEALAAATPDGNSAMPYLGAVLGLRWGECAGLRVGRVDFLRQTVSVVEQRTRGTGGVMIEGAPKSHAGHRTLAVPGWLMSMLAEHLADRGLTGADVDEHVFVSTTGRPLQYTNWRRRVWIPACTAAGLGGLVFHDLRRANATAMVVGGVDMKTAQTRLGHSDPRLTLAVYAQATTEADRRAAEHLGAGFEPTPMSGDSRGRAKTARVGLGSGRS
jgi:integrase